MKIACVIVTYNRKNLLINCLDAVNGQTLKPTKVFITDNASTDGTRELVNKCGYFNVIRNDIEYKYIQNTQNEGGAGGFFIGMNAAFNEGQYDAYWVMDDDGVPDSKCLEKLVQYAEKYNYLSPMVVDIQDETMTAFMGLPVKDLLSRAHDGLINNESNPFNGVLFTHKFVRSVGFPQKEMFIWGDEINYNIRARQKGFVPVMVVEAIHRHPINRQQTDTYWGKRTCIVTNSNLKLFCLLRNMIYNYRISQPFHMAIILTIKQLIIYNLYYFVKLHDLRKTKIVNRAIFKGFVKNFNGLEKYRI